MRRATHHSNLDHRVDGHVVGARAPCEVRGGGQHLTVRSKFDAAGGDAHSRLLLVQPLVVATTTLLR